MMETAANENIDNMDAVSSSPSGIFNMSIQPNENNNNDLGENLCSPRCITDIGMFSDFDMDDYSDYDSFSDQEDDSQVDSDGHDSCETEKEKSNSSDNPVCPPPLQALISNVTDEELVSPYEVQKMHLFKSNVINGPLQNGTGLHFRNGDESHRSSKICLLNIIPALKRSAEMFKNIIQSNKIRRVKSTLAVLRDCRATPQYAFKTLHHILRRDFKAWTTQVNPSARTIKCDVSIKINEKNIPYTIIAGVVMYGPKRVHIFLTRVFDNKEARRNAGGGELDFFCTKLYEALLARFWIRRQIYEEMREPL